jgi:uncharacterized protein involved in cysteine biosynthesis
MAQLCGLVAAAWWAWFVLPVQIAAFWPPPKLALLVDIWHMAVVAMSILAFGLAAMGVYLLSALIGAPFYNRLSHEVEILEGRAPDTEDTWSTLLKDGFVASWHSLAAAMLWVVAQALATVLNVFPVLGGLVELTGGLTVSSLFLARTLMDGPMTRRGYSFRAKMAVLKNNPALIGGFGAAAGLVLWLPVLNFVTMPAAVIGGTLLFLELEEPKPST